MSNTDHATTKATKYIKPEKLSLKNHSAFNEKWVQDRIAEDPSLLGLGEVILKDKERIQARAGRLDLLLQDNESNRRYEVEIQLGKTDESHIIRTIEYWDIERKRYPQYDHTAVIIAEDITSRFLNVISLFNRAIPLIAIQMQAIKIDQNVSLIFTIVLNEMPLGLVDEDEEVQAVTDRAYWEKQGTKTTLDMTDELLNMVKALDPNFGPKYNKYYIGLARNGIATAFVSFTPKKSWLWLEARLDRSDEINEKLEQAGIDFTYNVRWRQYRIRLEKGDVKKYEATLTELMQQAYEAASK